jgi:hypothetical protein
MDDSLVKLIELVRTDKRIAILTELSDRIILRIPFKDDSGFGIEFDPEFQAGRASTPKLGPLIRDLKDDEPLYFPVIWIEERNGNLVYLVIDGHQRIAALKANRKEFAVVQFLFRWKTRREAFMHGTTASNAIRFGLTQGDQLKLATSARMTASELEGCTGLSRTQAERIIKCARVPELAILVVRNLITVSLLASLIDSCENDPKRLDRLIAALMAKLADSTEQSNAAKAELKQRKGQKIDGSLKKSADERSYWRGVDWTSFKLNLVDGAEVSVEKTDAKQMVGVRVGGRAQWKSGTLPIWVNGPPLSLVTTSDLQTLRARLPEIAENLDVVINERLDAERKFPPGSNPVREKETQTPPKEQGTDDMTINSSGS